MISPMLLILFTLAAFSNAALKHLETIRIKPRQP